MIKIHILFNEVADAYQHFLSIRKLLQKKFDLTDDQKIYLLAFGLHWVNSWGTRSIAPSYWRRNEVKAIGFDHLKEIANQLPHEGFGCLSFCADSTGLSIDFQDYPYWEAQDDSETFMSWKLANIEVCLDEMADLYEG